MFLLYFYLKSLISKVPDFSREVRPLKASCGSDSIAAGSRRIVRPRGAGADGQVVKGGGEHRLGRRSQTRILQARDCAESRLSATARAWHFREQPWRPDRCPDGPRPRHASAFLSCRRWRVSAWVKCTTSGSPRGPSSREDEAPARTRTRGARWATTAASASATTAAASTAAAAATATATTTATAATITTTTTTFLEEEA